MTTAFDPATQAWLAPFATEAPPKRPKLNRKAIDAFIETRRGKRFNADPTSLAEDLSREGLWPDATPQDLADYLGIPLIGGRVR